jgi:hypothetical protein
LRAVMHLNEGTTRQEATRFLSSATGTNLACDWIGDWVTFWVEDTDAFTALVRAACGERADEEFDARQEQREILDIFNASFVAGVHTKNKLSLAAFLVSLRGFISQTAPNTVVFNNLEPYHDITIVQIAPDPRGDLARELLGPDAASQPAQTQPVTAPAAVAAPAVSERGPAIYYATIGDGFYLSTQAGALRRLIDRVSTESAGSAPAETCSANLYLYAAPSAAELVRPAVSALLEHRARQVSVQNMMQVWLLGRAGVLEKMDLDAGARNYLGYRLACPDGGVYQYDAQTGDVTCSVHERVRQPASLAELPEGAVLRQLLDSIETLVSSLRFTKEGVSTTVEIRRR